MTHSYPLYLFFFYLLHPYRNVHKPNTKQKLLLLALLLTIHAKNALFFLYVVVLVRMSDSQLVGCGLLPFIIDPEFSMLILLPFAFMPEP